jgi:hypothetical protein
MSCHLAQWVVTWAKLILVTVCRDEDMRPARRAPHRSCLFWPSEPPSAMLILHRLVVSTYFSNSYHEVEHQKGRRGNVITCAVMTASTTTVHVTCNHEKPPALVTQSEFRIPFNLFPISTSWNICPCRVSIGLTAVLARRVHTLEPSHLYRSKDLIVPHLSAYDHESDVSCRVVQCRVVSWSAQNAIYNANEKKWVH